MPRRLLFCAGLVAAVACNAFGADPAPEPAPERGDAGATEAGTLTPAADGGALGDVAAPPAADAGPFCASSSKATSCLDFDDGSMPDPFPGWFESHEADGKTVRREDGALRSEITATKDSTSRIHRYVDKKAKRTRISFRVKLDAVTIETSEQMTLVELLCFDNSNPGVLDGILLNVHPGLAVDLVEPHGSLTADTGFASLTPNEWRRFVVDVDWEAHPVVAIFSLDGTGGGQKVNPADCREKDDFTVRIGLGTATGVPATSALYDDVLYEEL